MLLTCLALATLSLPIVAPAQDEKPAPADVEALIQDALANYKAGRNEAAITLLQNAISAIQQAGAGNLAAFLPRPPAGWKMEKPEVTSGTFGAGESGFRWTQVEGIYRRESDDLKVTVTFTNSPQLLEAQRGMAKMFSNPQYLQMVNMEPGVQIKSFKREGWTGWRAIKKGQDAQLFALGKSLLATIAVDSDEQQVLDAFQKGIDFSGLAALGSK